MDNKCFCGRNELGADQFICSECEEERRVVLWMPNHTATPEQIEELQRKFNGRTIVRFEDVEPELFQELSNCPAECNQLIHDVLGALFEINPLAIVLPVGSPAFMWGLAKHAQRWMVLFAHSSRKSEDRVQPDGSIKKVSIFKHEKFI